MTNILNKPIKICSLNPVTGYNRDGYCKNMDGDYGTHVVCSQMTNNFLRFTKKKGNDLITPSNSFPGLKSGDKWCLCALRWEEARKAGIAPPVDVYASDKSALKFNSLNTYLKHKLKSKSNSYTKKKGKGIGKGGKGGKRYKTKKTISRKFKKF